MKKIETRGRKSKGDMALSHAITFKVTKGKREELEAKYQAEKLKYEGAKFEFGDFMRLLIEGKIK